MHPHARRPDNRQPLARANHRIRAVTVRCVGANGEMLGVMPTREALRLAQEHGLDLVEIAPTAEPPVCRIMDFGKYRYEESLKKRRARAQAMAHNKPVKEMKFPGKTVIFPQIRLPLTALPDLNGVAPSVYAKLKDGKFWTKEAEEELLESRLEL